MKYLLAVKETKNEIYEYKSEEEREKALKFMLFENNDLEYMKAETDDN